MAQPRPRRIVKIGVDRFNMGIDPALQIPSVPQLSALDRWQSRVLEQARHIQSFSGDFAGALAEAQKVVEAINTDPEGFDGETAELAAARDARAKAGHPYRPFDYRRGRNKDYRR
jgi:hypothetical protein